MSDFSQVYAGLDALKARIIQGAVAGLDSGAGAVQAAAQSSAAYGDQTGATRASTVAYVAGGGVEHGGLFDAAVAAVGDRNPAHVEVNTIAGGGPDEVVVILTTPTDYARHLEVEHGGAHAVLGPTMDAHAAALLEAATRGIGEVFR